jgi:hypothetical protein
MEITKENIKELVGRRFVSNVKQGWEGAILKVNSNNFVIKYSDERTTYDISIETVINTFKNGDWILLSNKTTPKHYNNGKHYDLIDVGTDYNLNFFRFNVLKYICRAGKKENEIQDLQKAKDYLEREIDYLTKKELNK